ncbi:CBS domain-containing protein [Hyphococcus luteus]|uniref:Inosine-5-monophosphate dehydrogenase n=1 Tax=Hyphococcus luteus TaxID=2058213 RepID=A0A2S7K8U7_9PROT|nr:CBS domain-containing protein [Marinicaulis flavus]PQA88920.1 inosine-5-monophosphate dehydrogenase [Marinicaulis flavus]
MKVEQILRLKGTDIFAVRPDDSIAEAVGVLNDKNIGAVVVRDGDGGVVGILSERDVVRRLGKHGANAMTMRVSECMTEDLHTCEAETSVDELMTMMTERRVRHLPVTNGGHVVGVVSIGDVVKRKIEEAEQEAAALKEYIAG